MGLNLEEPSEGRKVPGYRDLLHVAVTAGQAAADFIRRAERPRDPAAWARKGSSDFVTDVDRGAEDLIRKRLSAHGPALSIVGEEVTPHEVPAGLHWVVDPLDGTTNYLHGYPAYAVSIAAVDAARPVAGVVVDVARDITYTATAGEGAWVGDRRLAVSQVSTMPDALIGTGFPFKRLELLPEYQRQFAAVLRATSGIRRAGSAALDLVDVACGRFEGFWELSLAPWDVAAGTLLVREAGGVVTNLDGAADVLAHGSVIAGNPTVYGLLLDVVATA